jgi:predicted permease
MKETQKGLGAYVYSEWLFLIRDYYFSIRKNEAIFEIVVPLVISGFCASIYARLAKLSVALDGLANLLPTAISILIGFTIMLLTLLLTSSGDGADRLKK